MLIYADIFILSPGILLFSLEWVKVKNNSSIRVFETRRGIAAPRGIPCSYCTPSLDGWRGLGSRVGEPHTIEDIGYCSNEFREVDCFVSY